MNPPPVDRQQCDDSPFLRMLDVMLPQGGCAMVQVEAYFDESGTHAGSPVLCVAGYLIGKEGATGLTGEWQGVLNARHLPYFRMSACAHGNGEFRQLSKSDRLQVEVRMIQIIKQYTIQGLAFTVNEDDFKKHMLQDRRIGSPYSFLTRLAIAGVGSWLEANPHVSRMIYFFEAGHRSQSEANAIMERVFKNAPERAKYRYAGHAFVDKTAAPAIQAADLLAWQWFTDRKRMLSGSIRRKDCASLLRHHHNAVHLGPKMLAALASAMPFGADDTTDLLRIVNDPNYSVPRL